MRDQNSQKSYFRKLAFVARKHSNTAESNKRINKKLSLVIDRREALSQRLRPMLPPVL